MEDTNVNYKDLLRKRVVNVIYYAFLILTILIWLSLVANAISINLGNVGAYSMRPTRNQICVTDNGYIHAIINNITTTSSNLVYLRSTNANNFIKTYNFGGSYYNISYFVRAPIAIDCYNNTVVIAVAGDGKGTFSTNLKSLFITISNDSGITWNTYLAKNGNVETENKDIGVIILNNRIYLNYQGYGSPYNNYDWLIRSYDRGYSWDTPISIVNRSSVSVLNVVGNGDSSDKVYIFSREDVRSTKAQFRASYNGGDTWDTIKYPINDAVDYHYYVSMISKDNEIHLATTKLQSSQPHYKEYVDYANSNDSGITWGDDYALTNTETHPLIIDLPILNYEMAKLSFMSLGYTKENNPMLIVGINYSTITSSGNSNQTLYKREKSINGWGDMHNITNITYPNSPIGSSFNIQHKYYNDGREHYIYTNYLTSTTGNLRYYYTGTRLETNGTSNLYITLNSTKNTSRIDGIDMTVSLNSSDIVITNTGEANFTNVISGNYNITFEGIHFPLSYLPYNLSYPNATINLTILVDRSPTNKTNLTLNFWDEYNSSKITGGNIETTVFSNSFIQSNKSNTSNITYQLPQNLYVIRYNSTVYPIRYYYTYLYENQNLNVDLWLSSFNLTDVTANVYDTMFNRVSNVTIKVQKYITANASYKQVLMEKTDVNGQAILPLEVGSAYYKFTLEYKNVTKKITDPTKVFYSPINFYIDITESTGSIWTTLNGIDYNFTYNNNTKTTNLVYNDKGNIISRGCLIIMRLRASGDYIYNSTCSYAVTGNLALTIDNTTGRYRIDAIYTYNGDDYLFTQYYVNLDDRNEPIKSSNVVFLGSILFAAIVLGALLSPTIGAIGNGIGFIILGIFGIITMEIAIPIGVASFIVAFVLGLKNG